MNLDTQYIDATTLCMHMYSLHNLLEVNNKYEQNSNRFLTLKGGIKICGTDIN